MMYGTYLLAKECLDSNEIFEDPNNIQQAKKLFKLLDDYKINHHYISRLKYAADLLYTEEIHNIIGELWKESNIIKRFHESDLEIFNHFQYFLDRFENMKPPKYCPSEDDMMHCKSVSKKHFKFNVNSLNFNIYNHVFLPKNFNETMRGEDGSMYMNRILYVASLMEYNSLDEKNENVMLSSIEMFGICQFHTSSCHFVFE
jgi:hypothetical protein